jgi:hypothetical protein
MAAVNTTHSKKSDPKSDDWEAAITNLAQKHPITLVENWVSVDSIIGQIPNAYSFRSEIDRSVSHITCKLRIFDKNNRLLHTFYDVELREGVLYVRDEKTPAVSWLNYFFWRFYRAPSVNVNIKRK